MAYRSRDEILRFFNGIDLVEPGLTTATRWREESADPELDAARAWTLAGVGRKNQIKGFPAERQVHSLPGQRALAALNCRRRPRKLVR
jgi:hypothetical protein